MHNSERSRPLEGLLGLRSQLYYISNISRQGCLSGGHTRHPCSPQSPTPFQFWNGTKKNTVRVPFLRAPSCLVQLIPDTRLALTFEVLGL